MLGIKQEGLAMELGDDWNQRKISLLEQKEKLEPELLQQIASVLKIPVDAFQNLGEEQTINIISNTFQDQSNGYNYYPTFNISPTEKWLETHEEIKRLYERMLKEKNEMIERLEKLLEKNK